MGVESWMEAFAQAGGTPGSEQVKPGRSWPSRSGSTWTAILRAQFDVQMYTNDAKALGYELSRDVSHPTAIQQEPTAAQKIEPQSVSIQVAQGLSVS